MVKAVVTRGSFTKVDMKSVNVIWGRFPQVNFHGKVTEHSTGAPNDNIAHNHLNIALMNVF